LTPDIFLNPSSEPSFRASGCAALLDVQRSGIQQGIDIRRVNQFSVLDRCLGTLCFSAKRARPQQGLVLLFASLFTIPLARQRFLHAALLAWFQVEGVTFHFFDNVLRLYLALESAQSILKRLAFLYANLCQRNTPPTWPHAGIF